MSDTLRVWVTQKIKESGWSYRELARQAGISQSLVSRILSGDMPASPDFCIKVARALDVSPVYVMQLAGILPGEPTLTDDSPIAREIVQLIQDMPPERRQQVLEYVRFIYQQDKG
jgi:transcriptional regulator with XRE-family HTH domain